MALKGLNHVHETSTPLVPSSTSLTLDGPIANHLDVASQCPDGDSCILAVKNASSPPDLEILEWDVSASGTVITPTAGGRFYYSTTGSKQTWPAGGTLDIIGGLPIQVLLSLMSLTTNGVVERTGQDAFATTPITAFGRSLIDDLTPGAALNTLGGGTTGKAIFLHGTALAVRNEIESPRFREGVFASRGAASANSDSWYYATDLNALYYSDGSTWAFIGPPRENCLDNAGLRIWQRGETINASTTFPNDNGGYVADRIALVAGTLSVKNDGAAIVSKETSDVPAGATAALKLVAQAAGAGGKMGVIEILSAEDSAKLVGQRVSLSFEAHTTSGQIANLRAAVLSWTSTPDGMSTPDPIDSWGATGSNPTVVSGWVLENVASDLALTNAYQRLVVEDIAVDAANAANVAILIWTDDLLVASDELFVGKLKLEIGVESTPYTEASSADELSRCQRRFWKTFDQDVTPGQNTGDRNGALVFSYERNPSDTYARYTLPMAKTPTVVTYNPNAANANWRDEGDSSDRTAVVENVGTGGFLVGASGGTVNTTILIHATADAELGGT